MTPEKLHAPHLHSCAALILECLDRHDCDNEEESHLPTIHVGMTDRLSLLLGRSEQAMYIIGSGVASSQKCRSETNAPSPQTS